MNIQEKLLEIQSNLKAPKNQYNSFGNYKYRSLEDITEAVKTHLSETKTILTLSDTIELIGDRYYIKATATLYDTESTHYISASGYAREINEKKGMDLSQITGATSSYARKYALNGLFAIDDNKDADANEYRSKEDKKENKPKSNSNANNKINKKQIDEIINLAGLKGVDISTLEKNKKLEDYNPNDYAYAMNY